MSDIYDALWALTTQINAGLIELKTDGTIEDMIPFNKSSGSPGTPYIKWIFEDLREDYETFGASDSIEAWKIDLKVACVVKEINTPIDGVFRAISIANQVKKILQSDKQLGIPTIVRYIKSKKYDIVPYPLNKKKTLYGAGYVAEIGFIVKLE